MYLPQKAAFRSILLAGACAPFVGACSIGESTTEDVDSSSSAVMANVPDSFLLVHGYCRDHSAAAPGIHKATHTSVESSFWYWQGTLSDAKTTYDVPADLIAGAAALGSSTNVYAANWDGYSTLENSAVYLVNSLNAHCTVASGQTCALIGHSTGDALIGYVLDQHRTSGPNGGLPWNITSVYVAGGAGGGTEFAEYLVDGTATVTLGWGKSDPVLTELIPVNMRALYDHNMPDGIPNVRFVGGGVGYDHQNGIPYATVASFLRGESDGLVPFHSQAGVSEFGADVFNASQDSYCLLKRNGLLYGGCGQINPHETPADRWQSLGFSGGTFTQNPLFTGFTVALLDWGGMYNHTDEVGMLGRWVSNYIKHQNSSSGRWHLAGASDPFSQPLPTAATAPAPLSTFPGAAGIGQNTSAAPALTAFRGKLYAAFRSNDSSNALLVGHSSNGQSWSYYSVPGVATTGTPSLAVYKGVLYAAVRDPSQKLNIGTSTDGLSWTWYQISGAHSTTGTPLTKYPPALGVYNGALYLSFEGTATGNMWIGTSIDGQTWAEHKITGSAALSGDVVPLGAAPLAAFQGALYAAFRASDGSNALSIAFSTDGYAWSQYQVNGAHALNGAAYAGSAPSLAVYNGMLYAGYQANNSGHVLWTAYSEDGQTWTQFSSPSVQVGSAPALATFQDSLYVALQANDPSNTLYLTSASSPTVTGPPWATFPQASPLPGVATSNAPSLAEFKGKLYAAFKANDPSNNIYIAQTSDGNGWAQYSTGVATASTPSLAVYKGVLYAAAQDPSSQVKIGTSTDGLSWTWYTISGAHSTTGTPLTAYAPALAVHGDSLYLSFEGTATGNMWIGTSTDGQTWSEYKVTGSAALDGDVVPSGTASLAVYNGNLYAAFRASDGSSALSIAASADGQTWSQYQVSGANALNGNAYAGSAPSLAVYGGMLYAAYRSNDASHTLWTSVSTDGLTWVSYPSPQVLVGSAPALATFGSSLYVALQANDPSNALFVTSMSGTVLQGAGTSMAVNVVTANEHYITAVGGGGLAGAPGTVPLNTNATTIGPQETFTCVPVGEHQMAFQTLNGSYVTAVGGGGIGGPSSAASPIHTDAGVAGAWEALTIQWLGGSYCALQTSSGSYLTAVNGGGFGASQDPGNTYPIHTDATVIGVNETFAIGSL